MPHVSGGVPRGHAGRKHERTGRRVLGGHSGGEASRAAGSSPYAAHSPWDSLSSPGGVLVAYAGFLLLIVAGLWAAWAWNGAGVGQVAAGKAAAAPDLPRAAVPAEPGASGVARVTGLTDCRWANPATAAADGDPVPLGRQYALASGWLQIRYHTGAVVVIYGPAIYRADSATSGHLSQGKAGVWVYENATQGRGEWGSAQVSPYFFAIHTPRAVFYDICGNFRVAVGRSGGTNTRLVDGRIMAVYPRDGLGGHTISSIPRAWYFVDRDNPRGFTIIYRNDPMPWGLWSSDDRCFGCSDGTLDLQQWQTKGRGPNAKPKPPVPN